MSAFARVAALWLVLATCAQARADDTVRIDVRVVEVAGGRAYVEPGEAHNLRRGDRVTFGKRSYRVVAASARSAVIDLRGRSLRVGARGRAEVSRAAPDAVVPLPAPEALAAFSGQWPAATRPANEQTPRHVPLGVVSRERRHVLVVSLAGGAIVPLASGGQPLGRAALRARLHSEPFDVPFALDADVAAQLWFASDLVGRAGADSRPVVRVRELQAAYGQRRDLYAAAGRLRYAALGLGPLDGVRLEGGLGQGLALAAFGGLVPAPFDGGVDADTARFGTELSYEHFASALRPRVGLTAHGSRFEGELDERRLHVELGLSPDGARGAGYFDVALFDADNPWNAPRTELQAAGVDGALWLGSLRLGARADLQRPERSRWLAAFLPPQWLCIARPGPATAPGEPCHGGDVRYSARLDAGLQFERVAATVGGGTSRTAHTDARTDDVFASVRLLELLPRLRLDTTLGVSDGSLLRSASLAFALGAALAPGELDLSLRYRPALLRYRADTGTRLEHAAGLGVLVTPSSALELSLDADVITGSDADVVLVQLSTVMRL